MAIREPATEPRLNLETLREPPIREQYQNMIENQFQNLQIEEEQTEKIWLKGSRVLKKEARE